MAASAKATTRTFSSDTIVPGDPRSIARELAERRIVRGLPRPLGDRAVRAVLDQRSVGQIGIVSGVIGGLLLQCRAEESGDAFLAVNVGGTIVARHDRADFELQPGDLLLHPRLTAGFSLARPTAAPFVGIRVPRSALDSTVQADGRMMRIPGDVIAVRLLIAYLSSLPDEINGDPALCRLVEAHLTDLISVAIGTSRERAEQAQGRGIAAARFQAIRADLQARVGEPVTPAVVAAAYGITPRYLHRLFERSGTTFSRYVHELRLRVAYRQLCDSRWNDRSIADIAYGAGFADLSHFNRLFRRYYERTPSEVRACASNSEPTPGLT